MERRIKLLKAVSKKSLPGRVFFFNSWINFFHQYNLKRVQNTVTKLKFKHKGFTGFMYAWKHTLKQKYLSIYSLLSFYFFRLFFSRRKKGKTLVFNKNKGILVSISYKNISFFLNLLYVLKNFFNENFLKHINKFNSKKKKSKNIANISETKNKLLKIQNKKALKRLLHNKKYKQILRKKKIRVNLFFFFYRHLKEKNSNFFLFIKSLFKIKFKNLSLFYYLSVFMKKTTISKLSDVKIFFLEKKILKLKYLKK